jgi:anaerobic dimethyl sulfoxide reductase subunit A
MRTYHGALIVQGILTVAFMTGNQGKPGAGAQVSGIPAGTATPVKGYSTFPSLPYFRTGNRVTVPSLAKPTNPKAAMPGGARFQMDKSLDFNYQSSVYYGVAYADAWNAVIDGKHRNFTNNIHSDITDADGMGWRNQKIRAMIKLHSSNSLNQRVNAKKGIEAFRHPDLEFILVQDNIFGATAQHADIVLPYLSLWELDGHASYKNSEMFIGNAERIIEPMWEAKDSDWTDGMLCKMFGGDFKDASPVPQKQCSFSFLANAIVRKPDSTDPNAPSAWEPLISFTADDIVRLGVDADPTALTDGRITYQEFRKRGFYKLYLGENMRLNQPNPFLVDPVVNKIGTTQTGMMEIYCLPLQRYYEKFGFTTIAPVCQYQESKRGYEESVSEPAFPIQLINVMPLARVFSRPGSSNLKEVFDDALYINPKDAGDLKTGDTVLVTSKGGAQSMFRTIVTPTIMPGVAMIPCGGMINVGEDGIDRGGSANFLSEGLLCGQGQEAYNTCLVKVEKWTGEPLQPGFKVNSMADKLKNVL